MDNISDFDQSPIIDQDSDSDGYNFGLDGSGFGDFF